MFVPASNITGPQVQNNLVALEGEVCSIQTSESNGYTRAIIMAFFLLIFYALALWDRWMNLKSKELEKLSKFQTTKSSSISYGSILRVPTPVKAQLRTTHE
ncbi:hypothetical protein LENED_011362 [Lentinula edodes]|uniref:Uncharacterized protein n=1 Tax=Lentinula edodes TaxID=5353 RepID=A0A1Q3EPT3_LENED|nr:hypothetical protein LENED_011362 [Lentinula edodes]